MINRKTDSFLRPALLALLALGLPLTAARAQGTAFTYQGNLNEGGSPANGSYDFLLKLYNNDTGGSQVGASYTNLAAAVTNGLFTMTADFGAVFNGAKLWLQLQVRTNGATTFSAPLSPRQELTPTPYAIYSSNAAVAATASAVASGSVSAASIQAGSVTAANLNLPNVTGVLDGYFWSLDGNAGTGGTALLGTTDNQPLHLYTDNSPRLTIDNTGRVGVGTTTPNTLLEVNGGLRLDGNQLLLASGGDTANALQYSASGLPAVQDGQGPFLSGFYGGALGSVQPTVVNLTWDAFGNVWVSNNLATVELNIDRLGENAGSVRSNALTFGISSGEGIASRRLGTNNIYDLEFFTAFNNRMTIINSGAVGIGTTNPSSALLEVNGDLRIDNNRLSLTSGGDLNNGLQYVTSGLTNVQAGTGPLLYGYFGGGLGTLDPYEINLTWDASGNVWVRENLTIGGSLNVPATGTLSSSGNSFLGGLTVDPDGKNIGNVNSNAIVFGNHFGATGEGIVSKRSGTNPFDLEFFTDFTERMTVAQGGAVGIGTATPGNGLLEVNGDIRVDGNRLSLTSGGDYNNGLQYVTSGLQNVQAGTGPLLYGYFGGGLGTLDPEEINLTWDSSGDVWVRENLASSSLNVDDGDLNTGTVNANALTFGHASGEGIGSKRTGSGNFNLEFYTGFNNQMTIANNGNVSIAHNCSVASLTIRGGSDVAEPFPVTGRQAEPGMVMVIDKANPGQLIPSSRAYDTRVAGIISGAGGISPGIELRQEGVLDQGQKVALSGRVYVQADTGAGEIEPGDLLTTSDVPGRAMKVTDHTRAQGAILGKAMSGLKEGKGLVLVLVTLQ